MNRARTVFEKGWRKRHLKKDKFGTYKDLLMEIRWQGFCDAWETLTDEDPYEYESKETKK